MIASRALWISLIVGIAITGALSACATGDEQPAAPAAVAQCYWLSNEGAGWVARPDLVDAELCFEMDSCSGGVGLSGGGCYKWAIAPNAPATPWVDLGFTPLSREESAQAPEAPGAACYVQDGANWRQSSGDEREAQCFARDSCSGGMGTDPAGPCLKWAMGPDAPALPWSTALTNPRLGADIPPPRDLYEGSYEMTSDCHELGCAYGSARFSVDTPLYARRDTRAPIVTTVPAAECALKTGRDALLSAPQRGVVLETSGPYAAGDVVYLTNYDGEGYSTVWRRGEYIHEFRDEVVVRWDAAPNDPREGYWVEVTRTNSQSGWARDPEISELDCDFVRR
jgi:hypothetical protein